MEKQELSQPDAELIFAISERIRSLKVVDTLAAEDIEEFTYYAGFMYGILLRMGFATVNESVPRG